MVLSPGRGPRAATAAARLPLWQHQRLHLVKIPNLEDHHAGVSISPHRRVGQIRQLSGRIGLLDHGGEFRAVPRADFAKTTPDVLKPGIVPLDLVLTAEPALQIDAYHKTTFFL
jgi:hypothetical protein